jgi:hypothetical protein
MALGDLTEAAVRQAMAEFGRISREEFLAKYKIYKAREFWVTEDGRAYDSKALAGAAHGFLAGQSPLVFTQFSGGMNTVRRIMSELGFTTVTPLTPAELPAVEMTIPPENRLSPAIRPVKEKVALRRGDDYRKYNRVGTDRQASFYETLARICSETGTLEIPVAFRAANGVYQLDAGSIGHAVADSMLEPLPKDGLVQSVRLTPKFLTQYHLSLPAADPFGEFDPTAVSLESVRNAVVAMREVRAGQQEFRRRLLHAYGRRCAVSNCAIEEALEAAHIIPDTVGGNAGMDPRNGILLRADIHRLFDCGLIGFRMEGDELRLSISPALEGSEYEEHARQPVRLPERANLHPSRRCLERRWEATESSDE